jgi:hypothetical protein
MYTDADLETMDLVVRARDAANGVCSICDEALYPLDPKWANDYTGRYTAQDAAAHVGAVHPQLPYHIWCLEDQAN